jgi:DNA-binding transcriptional regulator YiaG
MAKLTEVLQAEIARLARKEVKRSVAPIQDSLRSLRRKLSKLNGTLLSLEKQASGELKQLRKRTGSAKAPAAGVDAEGTRLSGVLIKKLRKRLRISQVELASLVNVSQPAVASWEQGRAKPRKDTRTAIIALRGHSPETVRKSIQEIAGKASRKKTAKRKAKRTRKR